MTALLRMGEIADINKQLNQASWSGKDQLVLNSQTIRRHHVQTSTIGKCLLALRTEELV
jgi:hypothetical protein